MPISKECQPQIVKSSHPAMLYHTHDLLHIHKFLSQTSFKINNRIKYILKFKNFTSKFYLQFYHLNLLGFFPEKYDIDQTEKVKKRTKKEKKKKSKKDKHSKKSKKVKRESSSDSKSSSSSSDSD